MIRNVTWISESSLPCSPTANVILCTNLFTIDGQLINVFENSCPNEYVYHFTYEDEDLPEDYLDEEGPLAEDDITGVYCEDCLTKWARQIVDKAFELVISRGENDFGEDLTIPSGGPLIIAGGNGIQIQLYDENEVRVHIVPSNDADNQLILGTDDKPYVPPSLFSPDGWYTLEDHEDWVYASANTITIPAGGLLRFAKGDRIKLVQLGSPKYFFVAAVADTLLTVQGGSDYTVSNNPMEAAYLSKDLNPVGYPSSFNFSTTYGGFITLPTQSRKMQAFGRRMRIDVSTTADGESNATTYTMTVPVQAEAGGLPVHISGGNQGLDNGGYEADVLAQISAGSSTISLDTNGGGAGWTASGDKSANFNLEYYF